MRKKRNGKGEICPTVIKRERKVWTRAVKGVWGEANFEKGNDKRLLQGNNGTKTKSKQFK